MAHIELQLHWIRLSLDEGAVLLQAAGFPDCSSIAATDKAAERALTRLLESRLDTLTRHRHCSVLPAELSASTTLVALEAPARQPEWRSPVALTLDVLHYTDAAQRAHALVPALGLALCADDRATLDTLLPQHLDLLLRKLQPRARLRELAALERRQGLSLRAARVSLQVPSPRQLETRGQTIEAPSTLHEVSEPIPTMRAFELEAEVERLRAMLGGESAHSVLLVGPPGCGKTTLVADLARRHPYPGVEFRHASGASLVAGQSGFGQWQARIQALVRELAAGKAILHLGALTELMEVGRTRQGEQSMAGYLRGDIARGSIRVICECTPEQMAAIERDEPGLIAAFRVLELQPPDAERTRRILGREAAALNAPQSEAWLAWVERLHRRYAGYSAHPARCLRFLRECLQAQADATQSEVTRRFARETGLPEWLLDDAQPFDQAAALAHFEQRVMGQSAAVAALVARIAAIKADLHRGGRPLGSFLLVGPTGTGKTELAKTLAEYLFGSAQRLTRFDLSQASDPASVLKLIGSRAYGSPEGLLTARIREQPFSVLLLDEFEKAHPSFFDLLLQMLGDARLTDGSGRVADFSNCMILLTSNLGASDAQRRPAGFVAQPAARAADFEEAVRRFVRPELLNRLDAILPFDALDPTRIRQIAAREVERALRRDGLRQRGIALEVDAATLDALAARGFDPQLGARQLKRAIERELVVPIAEALCADPAARRLQRDADGRYRTLSTAASGASALAQAQATQDLRQAAQRVAHCEALQTLRDEATLLRQRLQRLARRGLPPAAGSSARLALIETLDARVGRLIAAATQAEDRALAAVWDPQAPTTAIEPLSALRTELSACRQQLLRCRYEQPDECHLLLRSDHASWLHELCLGCLALASQGQCQLLQVIERQGDRALLRDPDAARDRLQQEPQNHLSGAILALRGPLFRPLFAGEAGLHLLRPREGQVRYGLLQLIEPPYVLPTDWHAPLAERHLPRRRSFDEVQGECQDGPERAQRMPWSGEPACQLMARQARVALQRSIDAVDQVPA